MIIFLLRFKVFMDFLFLYMQLQKIYGKHTFHRAPIVWDVKWSQAVDALSHSDYIVLDHVKVWMEGGEAARELSAVVLSPVRRVKSWEDCYQSISQNRVSTKQWEDHIPRIVCNKALKATRRNMGLWRAKFSLMRNAQPARCTKRTPSTQITE